MTKSLAPAPELVTRFAADLDRIAPPDGTLGIAVSGGGDSLALLLLAAAARPGAIEAATVDHKLRAGSEAEAQAAAEVCKALGVPHRILTAQWNTKPETAIQERARVERYRLLGEWARERDLAALLAAHHLDDQAETLLMRLNRGSGARGLAGMRTASALPGGGGRLLRPLLGWRRSELEAICKSAGLQPAHDPSNDDQQFERVRMRKALSEAHWLDAEAVARSAANLAQADVALHWAVDKEWDAQVSRSDSEITYRPEAPREIRRRVVRRAISALASEGNGQPLRGQELDRLVAALTQGRSGTLRGVSCSGGDEWRFSQAPARRRQ